MFVNEVKHQCKWDEKVINRRGLTTDLLKRQTFLWSASPTWFVNLFKTCSKLTALDVKGNRMFYTTSSEYVNQWCKVYDRFIEIAYSVRNS